MRRHKGCCDECLTQINLAGSVWAADAVDAVRHNFQQPGEPLDKSARRPGLAARAETLLAHTSCIGQAEQPSEKRVPVLPRIIICQILTFSTQYCFHLANGR